MAPMALIFEYDAKGQALKASFFPSAFFASSAVDVLYYGMQVKSLIWVYVDDMQ
jgi:hypothetical protein